MFQKDNDQDKKRRNPGRSRAAESGLAALNTTYHPPYPSRMDRKRKKWKQKSSPLWRVALILIMLASLIGGYEWAASRFGAPSMVSLVTGLEGKNQVNILLVGTDNRANERGRSDTIVLASINFRNNDIHLLSIPRDTRASIDGHGKQKINHAYAYGGVPLLEKTVENLLDTPVDYYIETDFKGFERLIDRLGGVSLDVEKRMHYPEEGINLKPGLQKLDGHDALAYVRFRSDGRGDIGRIERQQHFFEAAKEQFLTLDNLLKSPQLIGDLADCVETNMPVSGTLRVANALKGAGPDQFQTHMLPGRPQTINGLSYWVAKDDEVRELVALIQGKK